MVSAVAEPDNGANRSENLRASPVFFPYFNLAPLSVGALVLGVGRPTELDLPLGQSPFGRFTPCTKNSRLGRHLAGRN
jgi:hypothetical protein